MVDMASTIAKLTSQVEGYIMQTDLLKESLAASGNQLHGRVEDFDAKLQASHKFFEETLSEKV